MLLLLPEMLMPLLAKLEMKADILNEDGETILHIESESGNTKRVRFILREFVNKNLLGKLNRFEQTALHLAVFNGHTQVAEVIIEAARRHLPETSFQAFLRQCDEDGETALHAAVMIGNINMVKLLVESDPTDSHFQNSEGKTPMFMAVEKEYTEIVELISTTCRAPSLDGPDGSTLVRVDNRHLVKRPGGTLYKIADRDALFDAAIWGDADAIAKLEMEADKLDKYGRTILHIESEKGNTQHVRFILREFANKNLLVKLGNQQESALAWAAYFGHTKVVEVLIEAARHLLPSAIDNPLTSFQAYLRHADQDSETALHAAVTEGYLDVVKLLVEADPTDTHIQNLEGKTPTYIALEKGYNEIVEIISTICTAPSLEGPDGSTALHLAVNNGNDSIEVVKLLIDAARRLLSSAPDNDNTDSNAVSSNQASSASDNDSTDDHPVTSFQVFSSDNDSTDDHPVTSFQAFLRRVDVDGNTALHLAVMKGNLATAKLLVEADPIYEGTPNLKGLTPFYIAVEKGYADTVKLICTTCTTPIFLYGPGGKMTALHAVIKNLDEGNNEVKDVIEMIIDQIKKHNINVALDELFYETDEDGCTILEVAVDLNKVAAVNLILDVQHPAPMRKDDGAFISLMPVIYKAQEKDYQIIVDLLTERYNNGSKLSKDFKVQVRLISAIRSGKPEKVNCLLWGDRDLQHLVTFVDKLGWTALHHAVYHECNPVIIYIAGETQKWFKPKSGYQDKVLTAFHVAAQRGLTSIVILLMQLWPSSSSIYTAVNKNGQNILHIAALQSKKDMVEGILINCPEKYKKEFVNKQNNDGNTTLHLLIQRGCLVPELLKYEGLDISVKNNEKWTPSDMLYAHEQIFNDQVKIKVALDYIQIDRKRDALSSLVFTTRERERKDVYFRKEAQQMIDKMLALIKENTGTVAKCYVNAIAGDPISRAALEIEADTLNQAGETILHVESKKGNIENVLFIVSAFANKNLLVKLDNQKQTALYLAAHHGHTKVVEALLNAVRRNYLPFSSANDDTQNVPNIEGKTPIYVAAEKGYKEIVEEICTTCTALSLDGPDGRTTALHALIQNIGPVTGASDVSMIRMIIHAAKRWSNADYEEFFCRTDKSGSTVLQLAVEKDWVDAVRLILLEDPAYQPGREIKRNGLMRLIFKAIDYECSDDIIKLLCQTYEAGIINPGHKDVVPLILAMKRRDEDSVVSLLGGAKDLVTFTEDNGWTPLHYAVYHEFDSILGTIIEALEDVKHQFAYDNMVQTPFYVAVECGYASTLVRLMQSWPALSSASTADNSPYTVLNEDGQNILHMAAAENRKEMVEGILKYCPIMYKDKILKEQDINGNTPLHLLISNGCFIPELIKDKGPDTMATNKKKLTPWEMLYLKNDVVGDQVHIKIAIDEVHSTNQSAWNLRAKSTENKKDIWKNIPPSKRRIKDVIFEECKKVVMDEKHEEMKKELERYKTRTNTQIIVTALITTVTFTVGFTMPGGLRQSGEVDEGLALLTRRALFNAFMVSDALALLLSTCSLFIYFLGSMYEDPHQVSKLNALSVGLNIVSVMAMMLTFITGTYLVLSHSPALAITVCLLGSFFFIFVIVLLIKFVYDRQVKRNED